MFSSISLENELRLESNKSLEIPLVIGEYEIEDIISESEKSIIFLVCDKTVSKKVMKCIPAQNYHEMYPIFHSSIIYINLFFPYPEKNPRFYAYVMPFAMYNLFKYVTFADYFTADPIQIELKARLIMYQLLDGCNFIHAHNICHGNITPHNILIFEKKGNFKATFTQNDFINMIGDEIKINPSDISIYSPPEYLQGGKYTDKIDSWSLGMILYFLLTGQHPSKNEIDEKSINLNLPAFKQYSKEVKDLVIKLLCFNPESRCSTNEALSHEWFSTHKNEDVKDDIDATNGIYDDKGELEADS